MRLFLVAALILSFIPLDAKAEEALPAARTWVFVAGLLEWEDPDDFESFPQPNRQDAVMLECFRERGVPGHQILNLRDGAATLRALETQFAAFLERIPSDGVLVFYYCGHGYQDEETGEALFAPWDASRKGGWSMKRVADQIFSKFKGERALLLADCCNSGAFVAQVRKNQQKWPGKRIAAFSSSSARESSTGDWTFTEAWIDALQGRSWVDISADGVVTVSDFARFVQDEMRVFQGQKADALVPANWPPDAVLAKAKPATAKRVGERVEVMIDGEAWKGRIIDHDDGMFQVRYAGYFEDDDEWRRAREMRPIDGGGNRLAAGTPVEIRWQGEWWPGRILKDDGAVYHVAYDGYGAEWNEWAPPERVRPR